MAFITVLFMIFLNTSFTTVLIKLVLALYRALCTSFHTKPFTLEQNCGECSARMVPSEDEITRNVLNKTLNKHLLG